MAEGKCKQLQDMVRTKPVSAQAADRFDWWCELFDEETSAEARLLFGVFVGTFVAIRAQAVVERFQAHAECFCRTPLVAAAVLQRAENDLLLRVGERRADPYAHRVALRHWPLHLRREVRVRQLDRFLRKNERAVHRVLQLAHVAWPRPGAQRFDRAFAEALAGAF